MSLRAALLLAGAALLQVTLLGRFEVGAPNLVLALCAARAWNDGGRAGMTWALAGGALLDLAGGTGPLGIHVLALLVAAYAAGLASAALEGSSVLMAAPVGALAALLYGAVVLGAADSLGLAAVTPGQAVPLVAAGALAVAPCCVAAAAVLRDRDAQLRAAPRW